MNESNLDVPFYQLVLSLQAAAVQQMGKVVSPVDGQVNRDLVMAKGTIEILEMVSRKTQGNLSTEEKRLLEHVLYELRLNYVDELAKEKKHSETSPETGSPKTDSTDTKP